MSRVSKNAQELKILRNEAEGVDSKAIFDQIKAATKQTSNA